MSRRRQVRKPGSLAAAALAWEDAGGFHAVVPGTPPDGVGLAALAEEMRRQIRASPLWAQLVREHGAEQAEALLQQIQARLGP